MLCKILGSGGAIPTPRPFCNDRLSIKARKNTSLQRDCSCFWIEDIKTLIDCPETIGNSANKAGIYDIENLFITHRHPDHTFGLRLVLESRYNFFTKESNPLNLYLHKNVYNDIKNFYPSIDYFVYEEKCANLIFFEDNENIKIGNIEITPIGYSNREPHRFGYLIKNENKSIFYIPCDTIGFEKDLPTTDILIHECGILAPEVSTELSFQELIKRITKAKPGQTILTHIEEIELEKFGDDLKKLVSDNSNLNISLANDGMTINI